MDPSQDNGFLQASPEDQHRYLMETDTGYAKATPEDQIAYRNHVSRGAPYAPGANPTGTSMNPIRRAFEIAGQADVREGRKTPTEAADSTDNALHLAGVTALIAGGGAAAGAAVPSAPMMAPAVGRIATSGAIGGYEGGPGQALVNMGLTGALEGAGGAIRSIPGILGGRLGMLKSFLQRGGQAAEEGTPDLPPRLNTTWVQTAKDPNAYPAPTVLGPRGEIAAQAPIPGTPKGTIAPKGSDIRYEYQAAKPGTPAPAPKPTGSAVGAAQTGVDVAGNETVDRLRQLMGDRRYR